jgi:DNA-binding transcriptional LysR family regulator
VTLEQLRIFATVAEFGHVTRAAESLGLSQSAASAAIAALETRYQTRLFDRIGRGIQLTETGAVFLREARAVLDRASMAQSVLEDLGGAKSGTVALAASQTIATYWLPRRLAAFRAANSGVRLDVAIRNTHDVETAVVDGEVNVGLVEGPTRHPALIRRHIDYDQFVLVVASDQNSPVDGDGRLDLLAVNWVIREAGSGTRLGLENLARREGLTIDNLTIALILPSNEAVREAIEAGAGATIISRHVVASAVAAGKLREIPIDLPQREYAMVVHRDRHGTAAQNALVAALTAGANAPD